MSATALAHAPADNPLAPAGKRFVANILNPRMVIETNDRGFLHRVVTWVRLFADTDLYQAKRPKHDVWGPGVAKYVSAMGASTTPLVTSIDPVTGDHRPGRREVVDEECGLISSVQQDVLLRYRDQQTGSPGFVIATGEVDVMHLLLGELYKLAGRDDVVRLVTRRVKARLEEDKGYDLWIFLPYHVGGTYLAANLEKSAVRDALDKHREMARSDKVRGKAASKGARLALKQCNQVPMHFVDAGLMEDEAGRGYVDVPVVCWNLYDTSTAAEQAIRALLEKQDAGMVFANPDDDDAIDPDAADMAADLSDSLPPIEPRALPQNDVIEAEAHAPAPKREAVRSTPAPAPKAKAAAPKAAPAPASAAEPQGEVVGESNAATIRGDLSALADADSMALELVLKDHGTSLDEDFASWPVGKGRALAKDVRRALRKAGRGNGEE